MIRCTFGPADRASIEVEEQHISRLTRREVRELILQLLIFGGSDLRKEIGEWLTNGKANSLGEFIAPQNAQTGD